MTLGSFLDAAYVVLVDESSKVSGSLLKALDANTTWRSGGISPDPENIPPAVDERQNIDALSALNRMMSGTQFKGSIG